MPSRTQHATFLENLKVSTIKRIPTAQWILWGTALVAAAGLFLLARSFVACWQLTALPGMPPSTCEGAGASLPGAPPSNEPGTTPLPTQAADIPEVPAPRWGGGSRINIAFFGLRG